MVYLGEVSDPLKECNRVLLTQCGLAPHCLREGQIMVKVGDLETKDFYCCPDCGSVMIYDSGGHFMYLERSEWER